MPPRRTWLWFLLVLARELLAGEAADAGRRKHRSPCPIPCSRRRSGRATSRRSTAGATPSRAASGRRSPTRRRASKSAAPKGEPSRRSERGAAPRDAPKTGELLHDHAALLRRPRPGSIPDRARGRDQRQADRGRRQPLGDAPVRLRPGPALHRLLRLDVPARRSRAAAWAAGSWASARARRAATTRSRTRRSPSTTSPASTRPRTSWSRSSISSRTPRSTRAWAARPRKACCWSARREPARRCWRGPSRARRACRSSR